MKRDRIKNVMVGIMSEGSHVFVDIKSDLSIDELNRLIEGYKGSNQEVESVD